MDDQEPSVAELAIRATMAWERFNSECARRVGRKSKGRSESDALQANIDHITWYLKRMECAEERCRAQRTINYLRQRQREVLKRAGL